MAKRIRTSTAAVALPALVDTGTEGYFQNGDPGGGIPATALDAAWFNGVQEEQRAVIVEVGGLTPSGTDLGQMAEAVHGVRAIKAATSGTDTGTVSPLSGAAVVASSTSRASGAATGVLASSGSTAIGVQLAAVASSGATVAGTRGLSGASETAAITGTNIAALASKTATITDTDSNECAIVASEGCTIDEGSQAAILGCTDTESTGGAINVAAIASIDSRANGTRAAVIACEDGGADGSLALTAASFDAETDGDLSASLGCNGTNIGGSRENALLVASKNAELATSNCLALGYHAVTKPTFSDIDQNLTIKLEGTAGNGTCDGAWTGGGADFAELFENATPGVIPAGALVTRVGAKVRPAKPGDKVLGVVSASPMMLGNEGVSWGGRYERDEFGRRIMETHVMAKWPALYERREVIESEQVESDGTVASKVVKMERVKVRDSYSGLRSEAPAPIPEDATHYTVEAPKPAKGYESGRAYIPRSQRPEEWTPIALVGQVRVRIGDGVKEGDELEPGKGGCAVASKKPRGRPVEVMELTSPFDPAKGYGVALCLVG